MQIKLNEEYRNLVPRLSKEDYERLEKSIEGEGVRDAIIVNKEGIILDGYTRYEIAKKHGKTLKTIIREFSDKFEERIFVIKANLERRHLNQYQRGLLGLKIKKIEEEKAKERQLRTLKKGDKIPVPEIFPERGEARDLAAKEVGISGRQLDKIEYIEDKASLKQKEKLEKGEESVNAVYREVKREEEVREITEREPPVLPKGEFNVIYADCPWEYDFSVSKSRAIKSHYPPMDLKSICKIKVPAANDAILFLWIPVPKIQEGLKVVEAWCFEYKTGMVWMKDKIGMGYYIRNQHELLFIASKGKMPLPAPKNRPSSVIKAPREKHSQKPRIYNIIEQMYPKGKYLELFQRGPKQRGWEVWGMEADERKN